MNFFSRIMVITLTASVIVSVMGHEISKYSLSDEKTVFR